jgi:fucose permease
MTGDEPRLRRAAAAPRSRATVPIALLAFVGLGIPDGMLGVAWPSIRATFDEPLSGLGWLLLAGTCGYLTASSASGFVSDRLGTGVLLMGAAAASSAAMLAFAIVPVWPLLLLGALVLGLGGGAVDAGANAYMALAHGTGPMNLLHACYGFGAAIGPLAITATLAGGRSWRAPYAGMIGLELALLAAFALTARSWSGRRTATALSGPPAAAPRWTLLSVGLALFFTYTAIEVATGQWSYTFLTAARAIPTAGAGLAVSAYWAGLTVGRLGAAVVGRRLGLLRLLHASVVLTLAALALFWWAPAPAGGAGLVLAGVGLAPIFPALVTLTPPRVGESAAARVVGLQLGAAGAGGSLGPAAIGLVLQRGGAGLLAPCLMAGGAALAALHLAAAWLARPRAGRPPAFPPPEREVRVGD